MNAADVPSELFLTDEERATMRRAFADPLVGFSTLGLGARPMGSSIRSQVSELIVHCNVSILITTGSVDVAAQDEVFPIQASLWEPERIPPWFRRGEARLDPKAEPHLDLVTPLGRVVEPSIFTVVEPPFGEVKEATEFDAGLLLAIGGWRLLIESAWHTGLEGWTMDIALSTDPRTIDERLSQGTIRSLNP